MRRYLSLTILILLDFLLQVHTQARFKHSLTMTPKFERQLFVNHPWHGVKEGPDSPTVTNAIIEIEEGSSVKYELDKESGLLRLDRILNAPVGFPINYGFLPQTLGKDNDPLDIMVISSVKI